MHSNNKLLLNIHVITVILSAFSSGMCLIFRQYFTIANNDQRLQYKQDFNTEYEEYRQLHAKIDKVSQKFLQLQILRKQTPRDSLEFEVGLRTSQGGSVGGRLTQVTTPVTVVCGK